MRRPGILKAILALVPTERSYLAGIIDGEGAVSVIRERPHEPQHHARYRLQVWICSTDKSLFNWMSAKLGSPHWRRKPTNPRHRVSWMLGLHGNLAAVFLQSIEPYIIIKTRQIELALEFQSRVNSFPQTGERTADLEQFWLSMKALNKKGPRGGDAT